MSNMADNRKFYLMLIGTVCTVAGVMMVLANDRQEFAVSQERLASSVENLYKIAEKQEHAISVQNQTLKTLVEQNATVSVLQVQVSDICRRLEKLED